jgi:hypothetical protein
VLALLKASIIKYAVEIHEKDSEENKVLLSFV